MSKWGVGSRYLLLLYFAHSCLYIRAGTHFCLEIWQTFYQSNNAKRVLAVPVWHLICSYFTYMPSVQYVFRNGMEVFVIFSTPYAVTLTSQLWTSLLACLIVSFLFDFLNKKKDGVNVCTVVRHFSLEIQFSPVPCLVPRSQTRFWIRKAVRAVWNFLEAFRSRNWIFISALPQTMALLRTVTFI